MVTHYLVDLLVQLSQAGDAGGPSNPIHLCPCARPAISSHSPTHLALPRIDGTGSSPRRDRREETGKKVVRRSKGRWVIGGIADCAVKVDRVRWWEVHDAAHVVKATRPTLAARIAARYRGVRRGPGARLGKKVKGRLGNRWNHRLRRPGIARGVGRQVHDAAHVVVVTHS